MGTEVRHFSVISYQLSVMGINLMSTLAFMSANLLIKLLLVLNVEV